MRRAKPNASGSAPGMDDGTASRDPDPRGKSRGPGAPAQTGGFCTDETGRRQTVAICAPYHRSIMPGSIITPFGQAQSVDSEPLWPNSHSFRVQHRVNFTDGVS